MSLYLIPFLAIFLGWLTNKITIHLLFRTLAGKQQQLANQLGKLAAEQFDLSTQLTSEEKIKSMIPLVEAQMDIFLREKLPEAMPVFKMFIGDSTIQQVKKVLVAELDKIFPELISQYLHDLDLSPIISQKIAAVSIPTLKKHIYSTYGRQLRLMELAAAGLGLLTGLLQFFLALQHVA